VGRAHADRPLILGAIDLLGLALRKPRTVRLVHAAPAVVGIASLHVVYETGEHGAERVCSTRAARVCEAAKAVERLLLAGSEGVS
jgi:hypothetical protein